MVCFCLVLYSCGYFVRHLIFQVKHTAGKSQSSKVLMDSHLSSAKSTLPSTQSPLQWVNWVNIGKL